MNALKSIRFDTDGWRAVIGDKMTFENVRIIAQAIADYLNMKNDNNRVAVSYDTRFLSEQFAETIAEILASNNISVALSSHSTPTPVLSFNVKNSGFTVGIMVTASHNPYTYNGIKLRESYGGPAQPELIASIENFLYKTPPRSDTSLHKKSIEHLDYYAPYHLHILNLLDIERIRALQGTIIYDAMYGAGATYLEDLLRHCGVACRSLHSSWNPGFNKIPPDPIYHNLQTLQTELYYGKEILGISTDGDADRIGILDENGHFVPMHELFALLFRYLFEIKGWTGSVVRTTSMANTIDQIADAHSIDVIEVPVGFQHVSKEMRRRNIMIGGEENGGIGYGAFLPERDGLLSSLLILEMLSYYRKPISKLIADLRTEFGYISYDKLDFPSPS
jgi:phosphomannomutase